MVMFSASDNREDALHHIEEIDARDEHQEFVDKVKVVFWMVKTTAMFMQVKSQELNPTNTMKWTQKNLWNRSQTPCDFLFRVMTGADRPALMLARI